HAQVELLAAQVEHMLGQFGGRLFAKFLQIHHSTVRIVNCVCTESLAAARRNASRASASDTPSISYSMRPGWIGATQYSTLPLPLPRRTSIGFLVIGLSGNTRIHSLPPRLTKRVMQRRAASIWRAVSWPWVVALRPYSPKLTLFETWDSPSLRPLWTLRYLVRLGCSMIQLLTSRRGAAHARRRPASQPGAVRARRRLRPWHPGPRRAGRRSRPCRPIP